MRFKSVLVVAIASFAVALSVGAAGASAAEWHVANNPLVESAGLASKPTVVSKVFVYYLNSEVLKCNEVELKNGKITAHAGGSIEHLVLRECSSGIPGCAVPRTIESKPLVIETVLGAKSPEDTLILKPASGTVFMEYNVSSSGGECGAFEGTTQLTGKMSNPLPKGREELASQELRLSAGTSGELRWGSAPVTVNGTIDVKLGSGQTWSFR